jgi:TolB protein
VDHFEFICNGKVVRELKLTPDRQSANIRETLPISQTGWCLLRASSDKSEHPVLDDYVYATTSPIYIHVAGSTTHPKEDAAFFLTWIDRLTASVNSSTDWNTDTEKAAVLQTLNQARQVYLHLQN